MLLYHNRVEPDSNGSGMEFLSFGYLIKTKHQIWAPTSSLAIRHQEAPCCLKYINQMLCPDLSCSQFRTKKEYISLTKLWAKVYFIQYSECVNSQFLLDLKITYCIIVIALTKLTTLFNTLCNIPLTYSHWNISTNERFFSRDWKPLCNCANIHSIYGFELIVRAFWLTHSKKIPEYDCNHRKHLLLLMFEMQTLRFWVIAWKSANIPRSIFNKRICAIKRLIFSFSPCFLINCGRLNKHIMKSELGARGKPHNQWTIDSMDVLQMIKFI